MTLQRDSGDAESHTEPIDGRIPWGNRQRKAGVPAVGFRLDVITAYKADVTMRKVPGGDYVYT